MARIKTTQTKKSDQAALNLTYNDILEGKLHPDIARELNGDAHQPY